jgi:hypothetical protein
MTRLEVLNPVGRVHVAERIPPAPRLSGLAGKRIALYWNGKSGGDLLLARIAERLRARTPDVRFAPVSGSIGSGRVSASPEDIRRIAAAADGIIAATAD